MEQEYPFRPRGRHGFDREDVINYIAQAQQRCNEHLARMEELESAKNAWYTQAKGIEREKAALISRTRELEEQLERCVAPAGGEWPQQADPMLASFQESQELVAVRTRCLELEELLSQQSAQAAAQEQALAEAKQLAENLRAENAALAEDIQAREDELPRFTLHQQETDDLRAQIDQLKTKLFAAQEQAVRAASLEQKLADVEVERSAFAAQMPALQQQLTRLAESAEKIPALEAAKAELDAVKAALAAELAAARAELDAAKQELTAAAESAGSQTQALAAELEAAQAALDAAKQELAAANAQLAAAAEKAETQTQALAIAQQECENLSLRCAALAREEANARHTHDSLAAEAEALRAQINELENQKSQPSEEALRSMVMASFNYSNLYVDNNLKTAQFISDATSRNIGRVSDSANSLLEQLDAIARSFNDTTDGIRRNLASFQRELGTIQSGMNRRLGKDRFAALLEDNERLRARLETELLAELSSEENERPAPLPVGEDARLPFAEDLPKNYHEYLDD